MNFKNLLLQTREVFRMIIVIFKQADLTLLATSLSFSSIFSLVPILALFMAISRVSGNFWDFASQVRGGFLQYIAPGEGATDLVAQLSLTISRMDPRGIGIFGLLGILITATRMIYDLDTTVLRIWGTKRKAHWLKRFCIYILILGVSPLLLLVTAGILDWTTLNQFIGLFLKTTSLLLFACLFICFKFAPPGMISKRAALLGTLFTFVGLSLGKGIYTWVTHNIFSYSKIYGSLAFLPLFLFWLFVIWCLILMGLTITKAVDEVVSGRTAKDLIK